MLAEDDSSASDQAANTKTKIVVHINNYLLDNEDENTSNDMNQLRSLASPDSFFLENGSHYGSQYNDVDMSRIKKVMPPKTNDTYIVHAKSMKFPVKIRPSYEIYPTSNVREDKNNPFLNNKNFNSKFDINFQLPFISPSHQTSFQNYQARQNYNLATNIKPTAKVSLPNYLSTQCNMKAPCFSNRNSKSNPMLTYKKIVKFREANSNENVSEKKEVIMRRPKVEVTTESKKNLITYGQNFESGSIEHMGESVSSRTDKSSPDKSLENAHSQKNFRVVHRKKDASLMKPINYSFKLPPFLTSKYATTNRTYQEFSVNLINQEIGSKKNMEEVKQMTMLSNQMDEEINKIIKNYPSIVVRRKAMKRF